MSNNLDVKIAKIEGNIKLLTELTQRTQSDVSKINKKLDEGFVTKSEFYAKLETMEEKYGMPKRIITWVGTSLGVLLLGTFFGVILWGIQQQGK